MAAGMQIGKVSRLTGLSADAIRFYERQRLLEPAARSTGGYRHFNDGAVERIRFIRSAQQLGFSLPEIRDLLQLLAGRDEGCSHVRDLLRGKLDAVQEKLRALGELEARLARSLRRCERNLKTPSRHSRPDCPVLREIGGRGGL
ncbi:MAG: MerR family transcriptional regulator [Terriglobales bacterium]